MKVLDGVYASGIRHWDTADAYRDSEYTIGQWYVDLSGYSTTMVLNPLNRLKRTGKRNELFLATKFGYGRHWEGDEKRTINGDPNYVPKAIKRSLEQLSVDYVDLWYLHRYARTKPIREPSKC